MASDQDNVVSRLSTPPSEGVSSIPVETNAQSLPFEELSWENFEKLCLRLARLESNVEVCRQYGAQGDTQEGIDIYARDIAETKYSVYQSKNEAGFGPAKISAAIEKFTEGEWVDKTKKVVLCTRESLKGQQRSDEVEKQRQVLDSKSISLVIWDGEELSLKLKDHPKIVYDFFGKPWVQSFCGSEAANGLANRLTASEVSDLRKKLRTFYGRIFNLHDRGVPLSDAIPLYERYVIPDIQDQQTIESVIPEAPPKGLTETPVDQTGSGSLDHRKEQGTSRAVRRYMQRLPIANWVIRNNRSLLFGNPGSGKSTFLRYLALDILSESPHLEKVSEKWGDCIPIWIPFALWSRVASEGPIDSRSVKGIASAFLKSWDGSEELLPLFERAFADERLLLLVDGLDEHSGTGAAQMALNRLETFLDEKDIGVIATSRPLGFEKLGMKLEKWQQSKIADFSLDQQKRLASIWFSTNTKKLNPALDDAAVKNDTDRQVKIFFSELNKSNELRDLASNPLLLCLLISFQIRNVQLPNGRFHAYQQLTDHLLSTHPRVRKIAGDASAEDEREFSTDDLKAALASLANAIHENHVEGVVSESDAKSILIAFLVNSEYGLGMEQFQATKAAEKILASAEDNLGILVKRSETDVAFFHRTIQEYLVSFNISRLPLDSQIGIVKERCTNPLWHEVVLGLFQISSRPDDIKQMVTAAQQRSMSRIERIVFTELLSEVAFGKFNCPPSLSRDLAKEIFDAVEHSTWLPYRERILSHILEGLGSPVVSELVKSKILEWFPDRLRWQRDEIFRAMGSWDKDDAIIDCLLKGLNSDEATSKRWAGLSLAKLAPADESIGKKLIDLVKYSDDHSVVGAALESLIAGWVDHPELISLLQRCATSGSPHLRVVAIRGKVEKKIQDETDLDALLLLASSETRMEFRGSELISQAILLGWPKNEKVKKACLASKHLSYKFPEKSLDREISTTILLEGYAGDEEVAAYLAKEIRSERFPFLSINRNEAFDTVAKNFKDHPDIVAALDDWLNREQHLLDTEVSAAALVGRTPAFKTRLLKDLEREGFIHWPARALVEGWGGSDSEVLDAIKKVIATGAKKTSTIAYQIPQIFSLEESRKLLLETLKSDECDRPDFVIGALGKLGASDSDSEIVDVALEKLKGEETYFTDSFKAALIKGFYSDPRVRELSLNAIQQRDDEYQAVARAYPSDKEIQSALIKIANPLPVSLRLNIAEHLSTADVDRSFALTTLELYDHERDAEVKVQAAIGFYSRFKDSGKDPADKVKLLSEVIVCGGPDHEERRMAALCGLLILGRLDVMNTAKSKFGEPKKLAHLRGISGLRPNVPFVRFLLQHWVTLQEFFKEDFWQRLFEGGPNMYTWDALTPFADQYDVPREQALDFLTKRASKMAGASTLYFLSRVVPTSPLLLEYSLNVLNLRDATPGMPNDKHDPNNHITSRDELVAGEIVGDQFGGDKTVLSQICTDRNKFNIDELVLVLSEGWPESDELKQCFKEMYKKGRGFWETTILRLYAFRNGPVTMFKEIRRLIRKWSSVPRYRVHEGVVRPLVRRIQRDSRLSWMLLKYITFLGTPSEKVTIARLLYRAHGITPDLRKWAESELDKQFSGKVIDVGCDITSGEIESLPHVIYEILQRN